MRMAGAAAALGFGAALVVWVGSFGYAAAAGAPLAPVRAAACGVVRVRVRVAGPAIGRTSVRAAAAKMRAALYDRLRATVGRELRAEVRSGVMTARAANLSLRLMEQAWHRVGVLPLPVAIQTLAMRGLPPGPPPGGGIRIQAGGPAALPPGPMTACAMGPDVILKALGVTRTELVKEAAKGATIASIAKAHGLDKAAFFARLDALVKADLDKEVAGGAITRSEADVLLHRLKSVEIRLWGAAIGTRSGIRIQVRQQG